MTKALAGCAAGGTDLPDVVTIENDEAEVYWARFPDCFANLDDIRRRQVQGRLPRVQMAGADCRRRASIRCPGTAARRCVFYRRDIYEQAGVDPASIKTWDDFIAAGKKMMDATGGKVKMATMNMIDDDGWFRPLANQEGCSYFAKDGADRDDQPAGLRHRARDA